MKPSLVLLSASCLCVCILAAALAKDMDWQKNLQEGYHQLAVGNTEDAANIFANKVKKYPSSGACHTALGRAYKRLGKTEDAKAEFRQAVAVEPTYPEGFYELGVVQEFDQKWTEAAAAFERYLQLKPDASERQALADRITFCKNHLVQ